MKEYKLNKTVLVVEVPENAFEWWISPVLKNRLNYHTHQLESMNDIDIHTIILDSIDWQILSLSKEMTEEKLEQSGIIAPEIYPPDGTVLGYLDYSHKTGFKVVDTCLEAFHKFMQSIGMPCVNTYGDKPKFQYEFGEDGPSDAMLESAQDDFDYHSIRWQEAEAKLVNTLILVKEE